MESRSVFLRYVLGLFLCVRSVESTINVEWNLLMGNGTANDWGITSPRNKPYPSARWWSSSVRTDSTVWLFGGYTEAPITGIAGPFYLGDQWSYDIESGNWTLFTIPDYIIDSPGNCPPTDNDGFPACLYGTSFWTIGGDLYLFGGRSKSMLPPVIQYGELADLWVYNGSWNILTFVQNQECAMDPITGPNYPKARYGASSWTTEDQKLFMFGGNSDDGPLNDIWAFDGEWISILQPEINEGLYVRNGISYPGARYAASTWIDNQGSLWVYGGVGNKGQVLNDLWRLDNLKQWTWLSGAYDTDIIYPSYGLKSQFCAGNSPGSRHGSVTWVDSKGQKWLFGGSMNSSAGTQEIFNDMWLLSDDGLWAFVWGNKTSNVQGNYKSPNVFPGSHVHSTSWIDSDGNMVFFSGQTISGAMNDMWKAIISGGADGQCTSSPIFIN